MKIGEKSLAPPATGAAPYIIAELGVNHDGSPKKAMDLAYAASECGVDAIKLQYFESRRLMSRASALAAYQSAAGETDARDMLARLELSLDAMAAVVELAHARGIHAIVTVFSLELVPLADQIAWDAYKSASPDIINRPLLAAMAATGKPLIISTGASTLAEVGRALTWLRDSRDRVAVLQCVSSYPTPRENAELGGIAAIADIFPGAVGYSDHTPDVETGRDAVSRGACILEKHFTLDRAAKGPDHAASLEPAQMREYVQLAREAVGELRANARYGSPTTFSRAPVEPVKRILEVEQDVRRVSRQSLVATRDLPAGHTLTRDDITIKRPGTGVEPWRLEDAIGKPLTAPVDADTPIPPSALAL
ncbi:MAG: N-acetylneuraminate synthase family protein [Phycisphaerales bacterium]|nr:N-acetylneuraminate synthase family protein [Phycisphaerales bacterium]